MLQADDKSLNVGVCYSPFIGELSEDMAMLISQQQGNLKSGSKKELILDALDQARNWTIAITVVFILIKVVLVAKESIIDLKWYQWFLAPAAFSYQHILVSLAVFALFFGISLLGKLHRFLSFVSIAVLCACQLVLTFMHISALKVENLMQTFPTVEMLQADTDANIYTSFLLDRSNLPYTLLGLCLSALAIAVPLFFIRFIYLRRLCFTWKKWLIGFAVWVATGVGCDIAISEDIGVAESDPVIYFAADIAEKTFSQKKINWAKLKKYNILPIYGDNKTVKTSQLFENLDEWRKTKKNVVLIVLESSPVHQLSFMQPVKVGDEIRDTTPNIRNMLDNMLTLENHYATNPTSMNALFSIGCSMYPYPERGIITKINPQIPCGSISEAFSHAGYKTALFHAGTFSFWNKRKFYNHRGFQVMQDAKTIPGAKNAEQFKWGIDELVAARTVSDYIHKNRKHSFFIQYIQLFPHAYYDLPKNYPAPFPKTSLRDKYQNSLRYADEATKIVIDGLKKDNLLNDTLVVMVGDHGEAFQEHKGNRIHSIYVYEENVHVGAAFYNPLLFPSNRQEERVTSHVDLLPTIADLVGLPYGKWWAGHSLLKDQPSFLAYFFANWRHNLLGVRDGRFKYILDVNANTHELYDLKTDPKEKKNLKGKYPDRLKRYHDVLIKWQNYQTELIPNLGK